MLNCVAYGSGKQQKTKLWRTEEYCVTVCWDLLQSRPLLRISSLLNGNCWPFLLYPPKGRCMFWSSQKSWGLMSEMNKLKAFNSQAAALISHQFQGEGIKTLLSPCHCSWRMNEVLPRNWDFPKSPRRAPGSRHVLFFPCSYDKPFFGFGLCHWHGALLCSYFV